MAATVAGAATTHASAMPANTGLPNGKLPVIDALGRSQPVISPTAPPYADTATNPARAMSQTR
jgi:hypothetical protein